jgi:NAD(P)-dependent dehydrogenase (short-subunit alcohol dehydrogenase family)
LKGKIIMQDKTVIVTGAFGALGQVVARTLVQAGAKVVLMDAAPAAPAALAAEFQSQLLIAGADLSNYSATEAAVAQAASKFGGIDALVNIAGGFRWETIEAGDPATWDLMFTMNLKTALHSCKAALPFLLKQASEKGSASIVNIGAGAAGKAAAGMGAYTASKAGVMRLTEALADETKDRGMTVNAILPGTIDTATNRKDMPDADYAKWVTPEAVADVVAFLLSSAARSVNGAGIPVFGRM